mgnify:CR=1 FL=1
MVEKKEDQLRLPPHSVEAEQAVLGCMLIDVEAVPKAMHHLAENSFYKPAHATIYSHMMKLFEDNNTIDNISMLEELKKSSQLDAVGGAYYITGLSSEAPSAANVEYYARIVKDKAILRTIISAAIEMSTTAYEGGEEPTEILDNAEQVLFKLSEHCSKPISKLSQSDPRVTTKGFESESKVVALDQQYHHQHQHQHQY